MSTKSNTQGRAYEYAFIITLYQEIGKIRPVSVIESKTFSECKTAWSALTSEYQNLFTISARAAVLKLFILEPRILNSSNDTLTLKIQPDSAGKDGDVRDILIIRDQIRWEIGLSLKHNHFAVKHSRLATDLDFGQSWIGIPCSQDYWDDVKPIFCQLKKLKDEGKSFKELTNKYNDIYVPILNAFIDEMKRLFAESSNTPRKLVEYLIGRFDFYKIISVDNRQYTSIQAVNLHGTLNKSISKHISCLDIPIVKLPKRLIHIGLVPDSKTTVELYMDEGWQFTFRIHSASTKVEPSLKFDIQIAGMPTTVITLNCRWL